MPMRQGRRQVRRSFDIWLEIQSRNSIVMPMRQGRRQVKRSGQNKDFRDKFSEVDRTEVGGLEGRRQEGGQQRGSKTQGGRAGNTTEEMDTTQKRSDKGNVVQLFQHKLFAQTFWERRKCVLQTKEIFFVESLLVNNIRTVTTVPYVWQEVEHLWFCVYVML